MGAHFELELPCSVAAAPRARRALLPFLADSEVDAERLAVAALLLTELVTNAVMHARTQVEVEAWVDDGGGIALRVRDHRPGSLPAPAPVDARRPDGRGLRIVDALSDAWGVAPTGDGKVVWAHVAAAPHHAAPAVSVPGEDPARDPSPNGHVR